MKTLFFSEGLPVFVAPVNDITEKWGVYSIPMMWRTPDGNLHIRINGEQDMPCTAVMQQAPNLYYISRDNGNTWEENKAGADDTVFTGIASPYLKLRNGSFLAFKGKSGLQPVTDTVYQKDFLLPDGEAYVHSYRYGDLAEECKGIECFTFPNSQDPPLISETVMDFPEREILINYAAKQEDGSYAAEDEYLQPYIFKHPYFSSVKELKDGTLVALTNGQHPEVKERYCGTVYLICSDDGGKTWRYRGTVAEDAEMPNGYSGDGNEFSMALAENGDLLVVMRMDMSKEEDDGTECGMMYSVSHDGGFTFEKPYVLADSSVTPQIVSLQCGVVVAVYGRPGVHLKYSEDCGQTWSKEYTVIGKNLKEEMADGKSYFDAKYGDTSSYSNVYVEPVSENELLILYNDAKYQTGDGKNHKATMVKKVSFR